MLIKDPQTISVGAVLRLVDGPMAPLPCLSRRAYQRCPDCRERGDLPDPRRLRQRLRELPAADRVAHPWPILCGTSPARRSRRWTRYRSINPLICEADFPTRNSLDYVDQSLSSLSETDRMEESDGRLSPRGCPAIRPGAATHRAARDGGCLCARHVRHRAGLDASAAARARLAPAGPRLADGLRRLRSAPRRPRCRRRRCAAPPRPDTLLNVSYDPTRELYREYDAAFNAHWQAEGHAGARDPDLARRLGRAGARGDRRARRAGRHAGARQRRRRHRREVRQDPGGLAGQAAAQLRALHLDHRVPGARRQSRRASRTGTTWCATTSR